MATLHVAICFPSDHGATLAHSKMARRTLKLFYHFLTSPVAPLGQQKMATVGNHSGEHEEPGAKCRPSAWYFIAGYDEVLDSTEMKDRFIAWLKSRENYKMVSLPSVDIVTFSLPQPQAATSTSQSSIKGFVHGHKIRQNAVLGYFLDDDGH